MIPREWTEPAIAAGIAEWHRGRQSDPALAPWGVPDLSVLPGYSLDDVPHNCVGLLSPGQARQATTSWLGQLACLGGLGAFMSLLLAAWWGPLVFIALIFIGFVGRKAVTDFQEIRAGQLSQVDGDIWTERRWDSESEQFFLHIDDLRLEITRQAYAVLRDGGPYRIYYLPYAKRAVGGQVLPAWRPLLEPRSEAAQSVKPNQHRAVTVPRSLLPISLGSPGSAPAGAHATVVAILRRTAGPPTGEQRKQPGHAMREVGKHRDRCDWYDLGMLDT
jgi:hypothetical protein